MSTHRETKQFRDWSTILSDRAGRGSKVRLTYNGKFHVTLTELSQKQFSELFAAITKPYVRTVMIQGVEHVVNGATQLEVDAEFTSLLREYGVKPVHRFAPIPRDATPAEILEAWKQAQIKAGKNPNDAFKEQFAQSERRSRSKSRNAGVSKTIAAKAEG
jgi:hypothetical protein